MKRRPLSAFIFKAMKREKHTAARAAKEMNMTPVGLSRVLSKNKTPKAKYLPDIAVYTNISESVLKEAHAHQCEEDKARRVQHIAKGSKQELINNIDRYARKVMDKFLKLPKRDKAIVRVLIDRLLSK